MRSRVPSGDFGAVGSPKGEMKAGSSSCLGRKGEGAFLVPGSRFRLRPDGSRCYLLLIPRDSVRKKVGEGVGVGGAWREGELHL